MAEPARFAVEAFVEGNTSVQEVSKIFEGLCQLQDSGHVDLTLTPCRSRHRHPRLLRLQASSNRERRRIAIDLDDQRHLFQLPELRWADLYFKRSHDPADIARLSPELAAKVRPFGLNNPAASVRTSSRLLAVRARTGRNPGELATDARHLLALPAPQAFTSTPETRTQPRVLFQTRLWPGTEPDVLAINEERIALLKGLRRAFGSRFVGGVIADRFAKEKFADLVTPYPSSMRQWPRVLRSALVAVYSRGLHDSLAFKMSEYLAASRCIVAPTPDLTLPEPLLPGGNFLPFGSPDECAEKCERLLTHPDEAAAMRERNWHYYQQSVAPAAHLLRILQRSFSDDVYGDVGA